MMMMMNRPRNVLMPVMVLVVVVVMMNNVAWRAMGLTCPEVEQPVVQCVGYLTGATPAPAQACCNGVRQLKGMVTTTQQKRFACDCIKRAATQYHNLSDDALKSLPAKCATSISFPLSKNIDCNSIQ